MCSLKAVINVESQLYLYQKNMNFVRLQNINICFNENIYSSLYSHYLILAAKLIFQLLRWIIISKEILKYYSEYHKMCHLAVQES